jgi:hypothetical protein
MNLQYSIRLITESDADEVLSVYKYYVVVPQKLCNAYYYKVMIKSDGVKFASYL